MSKQISLAVSAVQWLEYGPVHSSLVDDNISRGVSRGEAIEKEMAVKKGRRRRNETR